MAIGMAGGEIRRKIFVGPIAQTRRLVGADIIGAPARRQGAGKFPPVVQPIGEVAWGVALATMAHRLGKIGAPVPLHTLRGVWTETLIGRVEKIPYRNQASLVEGPGKFVFLRG